MGKWRIPCANPIEIHNFISALYHRYIPSTQHLRAELLPGTPLWRLFHRKYSYQIAQLSEKLTPASHIPHSLVSVVPRHLLQSTQTIHHHQCKASPKCTARLWLAMSNASPIVVVSGSNPAGPLSARKSSASSPPVLLVNSTASPTLPRAATSSKPRRKSTRVVFGRGTIHRLASELGALQVSNPLIVSSPSRIPVARRIQALIPNLQAHILDAAVVTVPEHIVDDAVERISGHDVVISVGGSTAVGLARAISIRKGIPHVCIPTTYSSFEIMPLYEYDAATSTHRRRRGSCGSAASSGRSWLSSSKHSTTSRNSSSRLSTVAKDAKTRVKPAVIIYDEELTEVCAKIVSAAKAVDSRKPPEGSKEEWSFLDLPGI